MDQHVPNHTLICCWDGRLCQTLLSRRSCVNLLVSSLPPDQLPYQDVFVTSLETATKWPRAVWRTTRRTISILTRLPRLRPDKGKTCDCSEARQAVAFFCLVLPGTGVQAAVCGGRSLASVGCWGCFLLPLPICSVLLEAEWLQVPFIKINWKSLSVTVSDWSRARYCAPRG